MNITPAIESAARKLCIAMGGNPDRRSGPIGFQRIVSRDLRLSNEVVMEWERYVPLVQIVIDALQEAGGDSQ